ncbi:MAG: sensor histidine kinase [Clostridia bacterium]|nr:sensor histidine kinase [Clostridia bacterium]
MRRISQKRTIRYQLTVILLTMVMIPLCILFFVNRYYIQTRLFNQTNDTYATALTQAGSYISDKTTLAKNLVSMLFADPHVQQGYDFFRSNDSNDETAWLADLSSGRVTYKGSLLNSLSRVYFYQGNASLDFRSDKLYASLDEPGRELFEAWYANPAKNYYFLTFTREQLGYTPRYVYLLAKVPSATRLGSTVGLMQADIPTAAFQRILDSVPSSAHSALYLVSTEGESFLAAGDARFDSAALRAFTAMLDALGAPENELSRISFDGGSYLAGKVSIASTDWQIIMAVPAGDITGITRGADRMLLVTMLILLALILPTAALVAHRILKPIYNLKDGVEAVSRGDYTFNVPQCGTMELDQVIDNFNFMREQTQVMMGEQYRMGQDLKNKELRVLQEQINPHFLYNTIDLLRWEARKAGSKEMEDITHALSQFYKLSLGHGEEIVTLGHEVDLVSAYMHIQNIRFMNRIQLETDVPEELRHVRIVKMVLQPLVENSIQHGIREKPDESGIIKIRARRSGNDVEITVSDDGVGMDEETIARIISSEHPGYGVFNVNDRLVLHYGSSAGLVFRSIPGEGTTVTLNIPYE